MKNPRRNLPLAAGLGVLSLLLSTFSLSCPTLLSCRSTFSLVPEKRSVASTLPGFAGDIVGYTVVPIFIALSCLQIILRVDLLKCPLLGSLLPRKDIFRLLATSLGCTRASTRPFLLSLSSTSGRTSCYGPHHQATRFLSL